MWLVSRFARLLTDCCTSRRGGVRGLGDSTSGSAGGVRLRRAWMCRRKEAMDGLMWLRVACGSCAVLSRSLQRRALQVRTKLDLAQLCEKFEAVQWSALCKSRCKHYGTLRGAFCALSKDGSPQCKLLLIPLRETCDGQAVNTT